MNMIALRHYLDHFDLTDKPVAEAYCDYIWWAENSGVAYFPKQIFEEIVCKKMKIASETREVMVFKRGDE